MFCNGYGRSCASAAGAPGGNPTRTTSPAPTHSPLRCPTTRPPDRGPRRCFRPHLGLHTASGRGDQGRYGRAPVHPGQLVWPHRARRRRAVAGRHEAMRVVETQPAIDVVHTLLLEIGRMSCSEVIRQPLWTLPTAGYSPPPIRDRKTLADRYHPEEARRGRHGRGDLAVPRCSRSSRAKVLHGEFARKPTWSSAHGRGQGASRIRPRKCRISDVGVTPEHGGLRDSSAGHDLNEDRAEKMDGVPLPWQRSGRSPADRSRSRPRTAKACTTGPQTEKYKWSTYSTRRTSSAARRRNRQQTEVTREIQATKPACCRHARVHVAEKRAAALDHASTSTRWAASCTDVVAACRRAENLMGIRAALTEPAPFHAARS